LDHYKFEMKHYGVTPISEFNEFKEAIRLHPNPGRPFRLIGLVAEAQHKIAKSGNKYGNFVIEDYSGKTEIILFSEDYLRLTHVLQQGSTVFITGYFKQRYNRDEFEFKVTAVTLAETMKKSITKQVNIEVHPKHITKDMVEFVEKNLRAHPGKSVLRITLTEPRNRMKVSLLNMGSGFEMNEEMIQFLEKRPELEVQVLTV
jgi:DNA polymerase-3 subunit alpha